jgi:hypothetical protein
VGFAFQKIWTTCTNGGMCRQDSWAHAGEGKGGGDSSPMQKFDRSPAWTRSRCRSASQQSRLEAIAAWRRCNATSRWYCPQTA